MCGNVNLGIRKHEHVGRITSHHTPCRSIKRQYRHFSVAFKPVKRQKTVKIPQTHTGAIANRHNTHTPYLQRPAHRKHHGSVYSHILRCRTKAQRLDVDRHAVDQHRCRIGRNSGRHKRCARCGICAYHSLAVKIKIDLPHFRHLGCIIRQIVQTSPDQLALDSQIVESVGIEHRHRTGSAQISLHSPRKIASGQISHYRWQIFKIAISLHFCIERHVRRKICSLARHKQLCGRARDRQSAQRGCGIIEIITSQYSLHIHAKICKTGFAIAYVAISYLEFGLSIRQSISFKAERTLKLCRQRQHGICVESRRTNPIAVKQFRWQCRQCLHHRQFLHVYTALVDRHHI